MRRLQPMLLAAVMAWPVLGLAQGGGASGTAPRVPLDSLRDVAVAVYDDVTPVVYYNPALMQKVGPLLSAFFFAHEDGHIAFRHTRSYALLVGVRGQTTLLQARELEADCYAAKELALVNPAAIAAAIRFFGQMGPFRFDEAHPTGAQRAARILSCLPEAPAAGPPATVAVGESPPSALPDLSGAARFTVRAPWSEPGEAAGDITIWIDDIPMGRISGLRQPVSVTLRRVAPGTHRFRITMQIYSVDQSLQLLQAGTVTGEGEISVHDGDSFVVERKPGGEPALLPMR